MVLVIYIQKFAKAETDVIEADQKLQLSSLQECADFYTQYPYAVEGQEMPEVASTGSSMLTLSLILLCIAVIHAILNIAFLAVVGLREACKGSEDTGHRRMKSK